MLLMVRAVGMRRIEEAIEANFRSGLHNGAEVVDQAVVGCGQEVSQQLLECDDIVVVPRVVHEFAQLADSISHVGPDPEHKIDE